MILIKNGIKIKNGSGIMKYNIKLSKGKININGKDYDIPREVAEFIIYETSTRDDIIQTRDVYKRTIDKTDEKNLDESDWLKGVTCFVINEKGEVLIEVRANKGLTPGKNDLCSHHIEFNICSKHISVRAYGKTSAAGFGKALCY